MDSVEILLNKVRNDEFTQESFKESMLEAMKTVPVEYFASLCAVLVFTLMNEIRALERELKLVTK